MFPQKSALTLNLVLLAALVSGVAPAADVRQDDRRRMVDDQLRSRGINDPAVLAAMQRVPRHRFVDERYRHEAYRDHPLPIDGGQTISQPYVVAYMTQAAELEPGDRVLEIGTGSGYQAAVLAEIVKEVYTIEILEDLAQSARRRLAGLGYRNVFVRHGDGYGGWPDEAPFDAILVTAAPPEVPQALRRQMAVGAHMILPVGDFSQKLLKITRTAEGFEATDLLPVRFVPMVRGKKQS